MRLLRIALFFLVLTASSCKKQDPLTESEKTAQQVQALVTDRNIQVASAYVTNGLQLQNQPFSIEGGFLVFAGNVNPAVHLNFAKLSHYDTGYQTGGKAYIVFYFSN